MTIRVLDQHQAWWALFLSPFQLVITNCHGCQQRKPNALSSCEATFCAFIFGFMR